MTKLVIVESPTKAKTIRGFLPAGYHVEASMGHVRDLPASAAEIPARAKGASWARLGVNVENDFEPLYVVPASKKKLVTALKAQLANADELILATDEDREGESIGWHLQEVLKPTVPVRRMVFHEITREAILESLRDMRTIDQDLVHAQETRRILDRLVGYTVSPLLWKKIAPKLSAGRVQSVAVRLLVLRERDRRAFHKGAYWDLTANLTKQPDRASHHFQATLYAVGGKRVATGRDFDESTGQVANSKSVLLLNEVEANALAARLEKGTWRVQELEEKEQTRSPGPPFTTSTLQQEANRKLGLSAKETMRIAQSLYENGYITYMRTDSVNLSKQAVDAARMRVRELYGEQYLHPQPRRYSAKTKNAQEAHEAIRPAGDQMRPADQLPLQGRERALYELVWKRTVATQMANARLKLTTATIGVEDALFRASGRTVLFAGYFRAYVEGSDDPDAALENQDSPLPELSIEEIVALLALNAAGHETKPPARYTESTLVKALEAEGIGRPSTYASIIDTILQRGYTFKQRKELVPTFTAFAVTQLLEDHFTELVDLNFTANMEQTLDDIANGDTAWLAYLNQFFLGEDGLAAQVREKESAIDPRLVSAVRLGDDFPGEVRIGQFGPYLTRTHNGDSSESIVRASLPPDLAPADLTAEMAELLFTQKSEGPRKLGVDPDDEQEITLRTGRFGPYVQRGDDPEKGKPKPPRASLLRGMNPDDVTLEVALKLLSLPRTLGEHPESGEAVLAGVGRLGPYVVHNRTYANVREPDDVLTIELDRALALLADKATGGGGRGGRAGLREIGDHPEGGQVQAGVGRFGPYVKHGKLYANVPKEVSLDDVTLDEALALLIAAAERRAARGDAPARSTRKPAAKVNTPAKAASKSATARKSTAAKKTTNSKAKPATKKSATATKRAPAKRSKAATESAA